MNFHIPLNDVVKEYVKWLNGFHYPNIPDGHKDAWLALSYLQSNYHKTADQTATLAVQFYNGLTAFKNSKEA